MSQILRKITLWRAISAVIFAAGLRQHCRARGLDVEVVHPVTLLARALGEAEIAR